jgi:hypothetical protein
VFFYGGIGGVGQDVFYFTGVVFGVGGVYAEGYKKLT